MTDIKKEPAPVTPVAALTGELTGLAEQAGAWIGTMEAVALGIFEGEAAAMGAILPPAAPETAEAKEQRERQEAAKIEDSLDNLPI